LSDLQLSERWTVVKTPSQWLLCDLSFESFLWFPLEPENALALASLDGQTSRQQIADELARTFKLTDAFAVHIVDETFSRFRHCLVEAGNGGPQPARIARWQEDLGLSRIASVRGAAPIRISLILTEQCNRTCRYCYMNAKHVETPTNSLDLERLTKLVDEAETLAVQTFTLLGGEPMLFPNSIELVNLLLERGFDVQVPTKNRFDVDRLTRVNRHNFHLEISLDSLDAAQVAYFTGSKTAFSDARALIKDMSGSGVPFIIKMVIGKPNIGVLRAMVRFAKQCGAEALSVIEYDPSFGRTDDDLLLTDEDRATILDDATAAGNELGQKVDVVFLDGITDYKWRPAPDRDECVPATYCDQGLRTLTVLPNGDAACCVGVPMYRQIRADNVFDCGIYGVWNRSSSYLGLVNPSREAMAGTLCATCDDFDYCNWTGRCQMRSMKWHGRIVGPDRECARYLMTQSH
jgi:MoaA/NifB/PqqE/SkfB family radical SAM enzyme